MGRNDRCRCGSGRKSLRCCGPSPEARARAELSDLTRVVAPALTCHTDAELHGLLAQVPELPGTHPGLAWALPRDFPPELEALRSAVHAGDVDAVKAALPAAMEAVDTQLGRAHLARAVLAVRDAGQLENALAAAAVADLASGSPQLVTASLVSAVLAEAVAAPRPSTVALAHL